MLFNRENKLLHDVFVELIVVGASRLLLLDPRIDREESGLVELLGFHQGRNPILLSLLKILNDILLIHQVLLVLAEVLCADIFYLVQLLVVLFLQVVSMLICFVSGIGDKGLDIVSFPEYFHLQLGDGLIQRRAECVTIFSLLKTYRTKLLAVVLGVCLCLSCQGG